MPFHLCPDEIAAFCALLGAFPGLVYMRARLRAWRRP
jgi:hypothetical protein